MRIESICRLFDIKGSYTKIETIKSGHINSTYKVTFLNNLKEEDYIIQKINNYVFKKPKEVMENIVNVTKYISDFLRERNINPDNMVLELLKTIDGNYYIIDEEKDFYRCYKYVYNSITYDETDDLEIIEESGRAFGEFQKQLKDFDIQKLNITIPHFHNTKHRYQIFKESILKDSYNRRNQVEDLINNYLNLESIATEIRTLQEKGIIPLRVTHNDTKINNVSFDKFNKKHLAVLDLDTIMPGLVSYDFGDAIRFTCNTSKEDEIDLNKVSLDLMKFEAFTKGFIEEIKDSITKEEIETLALGAISITIECGIRFLTDYLDGDKYFKIDYTGHNLDRSLCQFKLSIDMIKKRDKMESIIKKYS